MNKITIIIPVFNAEKTILNTLQSILFQNFHDFEILIVNDGSTDSTLSIIEQINDSRIKIITQPNAGVINAYICGIKNSNSKYIMFCDADDFYKDTFIEDAYKTITSTNVDVVCFNTNYITQTKKFIKKSKYGIQPQKYTKEQIITQILPKITFNSFKAGLTHVIPVFRWNKIYTKALLLQVINDLDTSLKQLEDNIFTTSVLLHADSIYIDERTEYEYVQQQISVSNGYKKNLFQDYEKSILYIKNLFDKYSFNFDCTQINKLILASTRVILRRIAKSTKYKLYKSEFKSIVKTPYFSEIQLKDIDDKINLLFFILLKYNFSFITYIILRKFL